KHAGQVKWVPNGKGLILEYAKKMEPERWQIGFISYPDGHFRTITNDTSSYSGISLSSTEAAILATVQERTANEINLLRGTGGTTVKDVPLRSKQSITDVTWSHDGGILWSDGTRLSQAALDGSHEMVLLSDPSARIRGVEYCADGHSILFSWFSHGGSSNRENVWRADVDGSNAMQLSSGKIDEGPVCAPDGKWVYFTDVAGARLMRVPITGGNPEQVSVKSSGT